MLSVTAKPFHPVHSPEINAVVYNDGIPSCTFEGTGSEFSHSITDETIDEVFLGSMTAQEAAELEAVEVFVEMMAALSRMEEREEIARFSEDHTGLGKRWEARRELVGKPRPAKHSVKKVVHGTRPSVEKATDLVAFASNVLREEHKTRQREVARAAKLASNHKTHHAHHQAKMTIQQPRKQY